MSTMSVCFVEDNRRHVTEVVSILNASLMFSTQVLSNYEAIDAEVINGTDLFVLDVQVDDSDEGFGRFVNVLREKGKPFMAFTIKSEKGRLMYSSSDRQLRDIVFAAGGLGVISKNPPPGEQADTTDEDLRFDLLERIMWFYWVWKKA